MDLAIASGIPEWSGFETGDFQWLICTSPFTPTGLEEFVADVSAFEPTHPSYGRQGVSGGSLTVTPNEGARYTCDDPTFPAQAGGETWMFAVLARDTGSDATDNILAFYGVFRVTDSTDIVLHVPVGGLVFFRFSI